MGDIMNSRGFSLIELVTIIAIVAIIGSVASASYTYITERAEITACQANIKIVQDAANYYVNAHPEILSDPVAFNNLIRVEQLVDAGLISEVPYCPDMPSLPIGFLTTYGLYPEYDKGSYRAVCVYDWMLGNSEGHQLYDSFP